MTTLANAGPVTFAAVTETTNPETAYSSYEQEESLDAVTIAELAPGQIGHMTREELIRVVHASGLCLLLPEIEPHLEFCGRDTAERLVYLSRRLCRNRTSNSVTNAEKEEM